MPDPTQINNLVGIMAGDAVALRGVGRGPTTADEHGALSLLLTELSTRTRQVVTRDDLAQIIRGNFQYAGDAEHLADVSAMVLETTGLLDARSTSQYEVLWSPQNLADYRRSLARRGVDIPFAGWSEADDGVMLVNDSFIEQGVPELARLVVREGRAPRQSEIDDNTAEWVEVSNPGAALKAVQMMWGSTASDTRRRYPLGHFPGVDEWADSDNPSESQEFDRLFALAASRVDELRSRIREMGRDSIVRENDPTPVRVEPAVEQALEPVRVEPAVVEETAEPVRVEPVDAGPAIDEDLDQVEDPLPAPAGIGRFLAPDDPSLPRVGQRRVEQPAPDNQPVLERALDIERALSGDDPVQGWLYDADERRYARVDDVRPLLADDDIPDEHVIIEAPDKRDARGRHDPWQLTFHDVEAAGRTISVAQRIESRPRPEGEVRATVEQLPSRGNQPGETCEPFAAPTPDIEQPTPDSTTAGERPQPEPAAQPEPNVRTLEPVFVRNSDGVYYLVEARRSDGRPAPMPANPRDLPLEDANVIVPDERARGDLSSFGEMHLTRDDDDPRIVRGVPGFTFDGDPVEPDSVPIKDKFVAGLVPRDRVNEIDGLQDAIDELKTAPPFTIDRTPEPEPEPEESPVWVRSRPDMGGNNLFYLVPRESRTDGGLISQTANDPSAPIENARVLVDDNRTPGEFGGATHMLATQEFFDAREIHVRTSDGTTSDNDFRQNIPIGQFERGLVRDPSTIPGLQESIDAAVHFPRRREPDIDDPYGRPDPPGPGAAPAFERRLDEADPGAPDNPHPTSPAPAMPSARDGRQPFIPPDPAGGTDPTAGSNNEPEDKDKGNPNKIPVNVGDQLTSLRLKNSPQHGFLRRGNGPDGNTGPFTYEYRRDIRLETIPVDVHAFLIDQSRDHPYPSETQWEMAGGAWQPIANERAAAGAANRIHVVQWEPQRVRKGEPQPPRGEPLPYPPATAFDDLGDGTQLVLPRHTLNQRLSGLDNVPGLVEYQDANGNWGVREVRRNLGTTPDLPGRVHVYAMDGDLATENEVKLGVGGYRLRPLEKRLFGRTSEEVRHIDHVLEEPFDFESLSNPAFRTVHPAVYATPPAPTPEALKGEWDDDPRTRPGWRIHQNLAQGFVEGPTLARSADRGVVEQLNNVEAVRQTHDRNRGRVLANVFADYLPHPSQEGSGVYLLMPVPQPAGVTPMYRALHLGSEEQVHEYIQRITGNENIYVPQELDDRGWIVVDDTTLPTNQMSQDIPRLQPPTPGWIADRSGPLAERTPPREVDDIYHPFLVFDPETQVKVRMGDGGSPHPDDRQQNRGFFLSSPVEGEPDVVELRWCPDGVADNWGVTDERWFASSFDTDNHAGPRHDRLPELPSEDEQRIPPQPGGPYHDFLSYEALQRAAFERAAPAPAQPDESVAPVSPAPVQPPPERGRPQPRPAQNEGAWNRPSPRPGARQQQEQTDPEPERPYADPYGAYPPMGYGMGYPPAGYPGMGYPGMGYPGMSPDMAWMSQMPDEARLLMQARMLRSMPGLERAPLATLISMIESGVAPPMMGGFPQYGQPYGQPYGQQYGQPQQRRDRDDDDDRGQPRGSDDAPRPHQPRRHYDPRTQYPYYGSYPGYGLSPGNGIYGVPHSPMGYGGGMGYGGMYGGQQQPEPVSFTVRPQNPLNILEAPSSRAERIRRPIPVRGVPIPEDQSVRRDNRYGRSFVDEPAPIETDPDQIERNYLAATARNRDVAVDASEIFGSQRWKDIQSGRADAQGVPYSPEALERNARTRTPTDFGF